MTQLWSWYMCINSGYNKYDATLINIWPIFGYDISPTLANQYMLRLLGPKWPASGYNKYDRTFAETYIAMLCQEQTVIPG